MGALNSKPKAKRDINTVYDSESLFLTEMLNGYSYWKKEAAKLKEKGEDPSRTLEFAEAYRLLLYNFSKVE